jgi:hypothetical protein
LEKKDREGGPVAIWSMCPFLLGRGWRAVEGRVSFRKVEERNQKENTEISLREIE